MCFPFYIVSSSSLIQTFSLLLVHSVTGLLTCSSCSTQSSGNLTGVYSNRTGNKSHILKFLSSECQFRTAEKEAPVSVCFFVCYHDEKVLKVPVRWANMFSWYHPAELVCFSPRQKQTEISIWLEKRVIESTVWKWQKQNRCNQKLTFTQFLQGTYTITPSSCSWLNQSIS